jgi:hypothetical protein
MNVLSILLDKVETYARCGRWVDSHAQKGIRTVMTGKPKLNYKVYEDCIKIKLKKDTFIFVYADRIELSDSFFVNKDQGIYYPIKNELLFNFKTVKQAVTYINRFIEHPDMVYKVFASRMDPYVVGKYKMGRQLLRDQETGEVITAMPKSIIEANEAQGMTAILEAKVVSHYVMK